MAIKMGNQRTTASSMFQDWSEEAAFFTKGDYEGHSCLPSFVEYLDKYLSASKELRVENQSSHKNVGEIMAPSANSQANQGAKSIGAERVGSDCMPSCHGPEVEFPVVSRISVESQKMLLEELEALKSGQLEKVDLQKLKAVQEMKKEVISEQEEFQHFVYQHAKTNHHLYNFIHPDIWSHYKTEITTSQQRTNVYPRHYTLQETVGLAVGAVFKTDAVLTFEKTLLQMGNVPNLAVPGKTDVKLLKYLNLPVEEKKVDISPTVRKQSAKVVSKDPVAASLAKEHQVDIVISSSGINCLLDNHAPDYRQRWQLPVTVERQKGDQGGSSSKTVVFIDKPLPPSNVSPHDVNFKCLKRAFRNLVCQHVESAIDSKSERTHSERTHSERRDPKEEKTDNASIYLSRQELRDENSSTSDKKETKVARSAGLNDSDSEVNLRAGQPVPIKETKFLVYNLWKFGKLRVLIRCTVDAYIEDTKIPGVYKFFSVLPKLEYQSSFGYEKLTSREVTRFWLHSFIRRQTKLFCGRINVFNSELLRVDELDVNDILRSPVGFNPAKGMKMVFQVFQALKRLPEGKYVFSHNLGEIHGCLYKSVVLSSTSSKFAYDLYQGERNPMISNYSESQIPWTAIDCNLFTEWQINARRIPGTFPPVPAKELENRKRKVEEMGKKTTKKSKKKKGNKKKQQKGTKTSQKIHVEQVAAQKGGGRKPRKTAKLFASFYDTQPVEKESEVFAVSRRAAAPVTYDDIDF